VRLLLQFPPVYTGEPNERQVYEPDASPFRLIDTVADQPQGASPLFLLGGFETVRIRERRCKNRTLARFG
jgi:hypothetical protein